MDLEAQLLSLHSARQQGRWSEALELSDAILKTVPDRFHAIDARALALSKLGRRDEAMAAYDHAVSVAEARLKKGLPAQALVVSMRLRRAAELATAERDAEALADLKVAVELEPKCLAQIKKDRALYAKALETQAGIELLNPKKVHTAGFVLEVTTRAPEEVLRSHFFALGTVDEVIAVLSNEFGILDPRRRASAAQAALTLDQSLLLYVVRKAEADEPIDLRAFVEICVNNTWRPLDAKELDSLRSLSFEKLQALELPFRIDEEGLRDELPASKRTGLKAGELLQIDAFDPFDGEDKLLQHGLHDVMENTFSPLIPNES